MLIDVLLCCIDAIIVLVFFNLFSINKTPKIFLLLISFLIISIIECLVTVFFPFPYYLETIILFLQRIIIGHFIYRFSFSYTSLITMLADIVSILSCIFIEIFNFLVFNKSSNSISITYHYIESFIYMFVYFMLLLYISKKFSVVKKHYNNSSSKYLFLIFVIPAIMCDALRDYGYYHYLDYSWNIILLLSCITSFIILHIALQQYVLNENNIKSINMLKVYENIVNYSEQIKENELFFQKIQHDLKAHWTIVSKLAEEKKFDELKEYSNKNMNIITTRYNLVQTCNSYLNAILNQAMHNNKFIVFNLSLSVDNSFPIEPIEFCSLLSNLIDNAVEATNKSENEKFINIFIKECSQFMAIKIENSISNNPIDFKTTKENKTIHGLGIPIINEIVGKYGAEYNPIQCKNSLKAHIFLKNKF